MEQVSTLTKQQKVILDGIIGNEFIRTNFYFTGGTALSEYYLHHRYSEDFDFFAENKFDSQFIFSCIDGLSRIYNFQFRSEAVESVYIFFIQFPQNISIKVDFNFYPYKRIKPSLIDGGLHIDSLLDIAVNKLLTVTQRNDVKDFVDLYFLEPRFGIWDLIHGVKVKFNMEIEPWLLSSDLLKVEDFDFLPKMIKPLSLTTLKHFFRQRAKEVGKKAVK